jgi:CheY-like chemotaxis protein
MKLPLILIVEGDENAVKYVHAQLKSNLEANFTVALSSKVAYERAVSRKPDLITMNTHYDDGSGLELFSRLKANPETARIPVVIITDIEKARIKNEPGYSKAISVFRWDEHKQYTDMIKVILEK